MSIDHLKSAIAPADQREAEAGQVKNNAGGYVYEIDDWTRLERFLILGSEGGTYYVTEKKLSREGANVVERLLRVNGPRLVQVIADISDAGRAPKNDPAILALAMAARLGDEATRRAAYAALPKVCRIGTHLYHFVQFADQLGGWGRGLRRAVGQWFAAKDIDKLAMQLVKYQQRDGWSARDLLKLAHPRPAGADQSALFRWCVKGHEACATAEPVLVLPPLVEAFEEMKTTKDLERAVLLIIKYKLPREAVPTQWLTKPQIWDALLPHMGATALIRNLGTMTKVGLVAPLSAALRTVVTQLGDAEFLRRGRVHPMALLMADATYSAGHGTRGHSTWTPVQQVVDALDAAFYLAFPNVRATGKNTLLAIDVSGSMESGEVTGMPGITPRIAAAAMALVTANTEPNYHVVGFTAPARGYGGMHGGGAPGLTDLPISPKMRIDEVVQEMRKLPMGGTDCAQPMLWATAQLGRGVKVEAFALYTDNETWAGDIKPDKALAEYRRRSGVQARSAVVGMTASQFSIANPSDPGMMDFVGMDAAAPAVMADFFRGGPSSTQAEEDE